MSAVSRVPRVLVRSRLALPRPAIAARALSTSTSSAPSIAVRSVATRSGSLRAVAGRSTLQRRWASSAAAEVEEEAAPEWPVREAPPLTPKDVARISRQRNIGM